MKKLCLAIGAGAIGKSVCGYVFSSLGYDVVYSDVFEKVVNDINLRGGYDIHVAQTGKETYIHEVRGVRAVLASDDRMEQLTMQADVLCTSVGANGIRAISETLAKRIAKRAKTASTPLHIFFFENDSACEALIKEAITTACGKIPEWLTLVPASIERMTKPLAVGDKIDVLSEQFIPVIVEKARIIGTGLEDQPDYFMAVDNLPKYYYRKLYTNNLGHAVLGYYGLKKGAKTSVEAMTYGEITELLTRVLEESGEMLCREYGFTGDEMDKHIEALMIRYKNEELADDLIRLARQPIRKIGAKERICGTIHHCQSCGVSCDAVAETLLLALKYDCEADETAKELAELIAEKGIDNILTDVCGFSKESCIFKSIKEKFLKGDK